MAKKKRLSVWGILAHLGHKDDDHDDVIQHVFEMASRVTLRSEDGKPMDGGDYLVEVFESLGTTATWPSCGSPEWVRLRQVALRRVVARLAREGLLDAIAVGCATDAECETDVETPAARDEGSGSDSIDGDMAQAAKDENPDPRTGVQVGRALIRRCQRNPEAWFKCVDRITPYRVLVQWAKETCPAASAESLAALMDGMRLVRWWDDDGHVLGAEMLRVLEAEIEEGCGDERWMLVVSDFEAAVGRLRSVFERLCLL